MNIKDIEIEIRDYFRKNCYVKSRIDWDENKILFFLESGNIERDVPIIMNQILYFERMYPEVKLIFDY